VIVCPNCRNANVENAETCSRCGASLAPGPTHLLSRRAPSERPALDIPRPKAPSPWRAVFALSVLLGVAIGVGAWYLLRPNPCAGTNFTSEQFGYCLTVPQDWQWHPAKFGDALTVDQFSPPSQSATVLVEAADLPDNASLSAFADAVRQKDTASNLDPGPISKTSVDGADALQWNIHYTSDAGTDYSVQEIVVVNDHFGWRMMLNDTASGFSKDVSTFDGMVRSFRFR
jgi:zinc-ribbon domain